MSFFRKKTNDTDIENAKINENIQNIIKTIEEFSDEQRELVKRFKNQLQIFSEERSFESCLDTLNLSMQLASTREKILETYKHYCRLLEDEIKRARK